MALTQAELDAAQQQINAARDQTHTNISLARGWAEIAEAAADASGSGSAQVATAEANRAAQQKALAEAARTGAETARTGAETARTAAETARTGAETARTAAEILISGALMSEAEATAGTATAARLLSAAGLKGAIQRWATGSYSTAISAIGQALNKAADAAEARTAIGAVGKGELLLSVKDYGAVGDGVANDTAAILAALDAAHAAGGGVVYLPSGNYKVNAPIGKTTGQYSNIKLTCDAHGSARIFSGANHSPLIGAWYRCEITNIIFDASLKGSPAANVHMVETRIKKCVFDGWTGFGVKLNDGTYGDVGLLNLFAENHVVQNIGIGIFQTYRWVDSWIIDNNVGSTEENLSLEGGPVRVSGNHFNGSPTVNIRLRGNKRVTVINNICEGALDEAIVYDMPSWLTEDDAQVVIANNNISNGGKRAANTKVAIRLQGVASTTGLSGFTISGNIIACEDAGSGWLHAVGLYNAHKVALVGNNWEKGYVSAPYLAASGSSQPKSAGNTSGNVATISDVTGLQASLDSKVAKAGDAATVWSGTQAQYDALPTATRNALGFIAVIR